MLSYMYPECTHFVANKKSCIIKKGNPRKSDAFIERANSKSEVTCGISRKHCNKTGCPI